MNAIYDFLTAKKKAMEAQAALLEAGANIKPKYEYDSDEETEGGTWEHKKRMMEMEATKGKYYERSGALWWWWGGGGGSYLWFALCSGSLPKAITILVATAFLPIFCRSC